MSWEESTSAAEPTEPSGILRGPLKAGERVTLTDQKGRRHSVVLRPDGVFHTTHGGVSHNDLIGQPEGCLARSVGSHQFLAFRPVLYEFTVSMPRGAAVVYPKDAAAILMQADIFPGARVLEAGVGSGALTMALLRAVGTGGTVYSYERREEFAKVARKNIETFFGGPHPAWELRIGDLVETRGPEEVDRVVLDMLAPWDCIASIAEVLTPGGFVCCYVATTTQMGRVMDTIRTHEGFTEPWAREYEVREWHAEGLAIRPAHSATSHTGYLVFARRLAPGVAAPLRRRRPSLGAYGPDYNGPRPSWVPTEEDVESC